MTTACTSTTGRWELDRAQSNGITSRRYIVNGATRGSIQGVGPTSCIATFYDRQHRRHQRPFWSVNEAVQWVEENA